MNGNHRFHYGWIILCLGVMTVTGALGLARFGYTMILPSMKTGLSLNEAGAGDLATGNLAGYLVMAMAGGFLSTRFSPRWIISLFMVLIAFSMLLTGLADDFGTALLGRMFSGMGGGGTNIPVMGVVMAWFSVSRRGFATGVTVSGSSFGLLITGLGVPWILESGGPDGWRYSWFFLAAVALAISVLCALFLRNTPSEMNQFPLGDTSPEKPFVKIPPISLGESFKRVYKTMEVWHLALIYALFGFSYIIYVTFFVRYLSWEGGFSIESAGRLWSIVGAVSIASGFLWGAFSDRVGRKYGLAAVFLIQWV
jgi:nitrate/nitrite transporter NarK